ncbi:MAG: hypothetical protein GWP06_05845 [Actinobacteria bacterium]|nr:hypothetical protein [Actinomycetota bacterium]
MRYLIALEPLAQGFSVQVPDLAIVTHGKDIGDAKKSAIEAIKANINTYIETGKKIPRGRPISEHLENPDFSELLFAFVDVTLPEEKIAA